jgi:hypothetical protein
MKHVTPSIKETAFNCPHCGALAMQTWSNLYSEPKSKDYPLPPYVGPTGAAERDFFNDVEDANQKASLVEWANKMGIGLPFIEKVEKNAYPPYHLWNVNLSTCFNCHMHALWIQEKLIHPISGSAPPPNPDMSIDIRRDYDEASAILDSSPRGAAALIRLCIQKLCKELGQSGENINKDIGKLVTAGLDQRIQQALDVVRVIGNNAVHPGHIDFKDDRGTAETLFKLLNLIIDKLVSEPRHIAELYGALPESQRSAIEVRDQGKSQ